jgi:hypothetical protein
MVQTAGSWGEGMNPVSLKRRRLSPDVIRCAVWLYFRVTLSGRADLPHMIRRPTLRRVQAVAMAMWTACKQKRPLPEKGPLPEISRGLRTDRQADAEPFAISTCSSGERQRSADCPRRPAAHCRG